MIRNISIFFTYLYDDSSHPGVNKEYIKKFIELSIIYEIDILRPFMNIDMVSTTIQSILFGNSLEELGNEWILQEYAWHPRHWIFGIMDFKSMGDYNRKLTEGFFTTTLINDSFSINWPRNNPLNCKRNKMFLDEPLNSLKVNYNL